jgi:arginyl-tRNA synthetase
MVQLLRGGEPVKMSKRAGTFVTLADVVREVGKDVVRFTMLTRKPEAQMDFDFAKVVEASKDNPVFYVQYAHARIRSSLRKAAAEGIAPSAEHLDLLGEEELDLVKLAAQFPAWSKPPPPRVSRTGSRSSSMTSPLRSMRTGT